MNVTDTLAMAICMQLSEDYADLIKRVGVKTEPLNYDTYNRIKRESFRYEHLAFQRDPNARKLYDSIIRKYSEYADILKSHKYI